MRTKKDDRGRPFFYTIRINPKHNPKNLTLFFFAIQKLYDKNIGYVQKDFKLFYIF